jgi:hypothetical protein
VGKYQLAAESDSATEFKQTEVAGVTHYQTVDAFMTQDFIADGIARVIDDPEATITAACSAQNELVITQHSYDGALTAVNLLDSTTITIKKVGPTINATESYTNVYYPSLNYVETNILVPVKP